MRALRLFVFLLAALWGTAALAGTPEQIQVGGLTRNYLLYVPQAVAPHPALVVILHGGGNPTRWMERMTGFDTYADQRGFIAVYPEGIDKHWNDGRSTIVNKVDDVGFISALISQLSTQFGVDPARVYVTGMSNGALMAETLGCRLAGQITAIAPVSGSLPADVAPGCAPSAPVSALLIQGDADPVVPYDGGNVLVYHGQGEGGGVIGSPASAQFWAHADGCGTLGAARDLPPQVPEDPTRLSVAETSTCRGGSTVELITIHGGGHVWPGFVPRNTLLGAPTQQLNATATIVDFFFNHPPQAQP